MGVLKVQQAAARLNLSQSTVYKLVKDGKLPTVPSLCSRVHIDGDELERLLNEAQQLKARSLKTKKQDRSVSHKSKGDDLWDD
jgi:excisionase family DNA binding protein